VAAGFIAATVKKTGGTFMYKGVKKLAKLIKDMLMRSQMTSARQRKFSQAASSKETYMNGGIENENTLYDF